MSRSAILVPCRMRFTILLFASMLMATDRGTLDWYKIKRSSTQLRYLPFNPSASTTLSSTFVGWPSSFHTTPNPPR